MFNVEARERETETTCVCALVFEGKRGMRREGNRSYVPWYVRYYVREWVCVGIVVKKRKQHRDTERKETQILQTKRDRKET